MGASSSTPSERKLLTFTRDAGLAGLAAAYIGYCRIRNRAELPSGSLLVDKLLIAEVCPVAFCTDENEDAGKLWRDLTSGTHAVGRSGLPFSLGSLPAPAYAIPMSAAGFIFCRYLAELGPDGVEAVYKVELSQAPSDDLSNLTHTHVFSGTQLFHEGHSAHILRISDDFRAAMAHADMTNLAFSALHPTLIAFEALCHLASQRDIPSDLYHLCYLLGAVAALAREARVHHGTEGAFLTPEAWRSCLSRVQPRNELERFVWKVGHLQYGALTQRLAQWEVEVCGFGAEGQLHAVEAAKARYIETFQTFATLAQVCPLHLKLSLL